MKHIIILGDGMADEPIESLGGLTPLQYAKTPYMDELARQGVTGRMKTVADGFDRRQTQLFKASFALFLLVFPPAGL